MFFRTLNDDFNEAFFKSLTRLEQDRLLQFLYDQGHRVKDIAKKLNITESSIYTRINAHRKRTKNIITI